MEKALLYEKRARKMLMKLTPGMCEYWSLFRRHVRYIRHVLLQMSWSVSNTLFSRHHYQDQYKVRFGPTIRVLRSVNLIKFSIKIRIKWIKWIKYLEPITIKYPRNSLEAKIIKFLCFYIHTLIKHVFAMYG